MMNKMMGGKKPAGMNKTPKGERTMPEGKKPMMGKKAMGKGPKAAPAIGMAYGGMATKKAK